jgi:protein-tyrosine kinase
MADANSNKIATRKIGTGDGSTSRSAMSRADNADAADEESKVDNTNTMEDVDSADKTNMSDEVSTAEDKASTVEEAGAEEASASEEVSKADKTDISDDAATAEEKEKEKASTVEEAGAEEASASEEVSAADDKKKPVAKKKAAKRKAAKRKKSKRAKSKTRSSASTKSTGKMVVPVDKKQGGDLKRIAAASRQIAAMNEPSTHTQEYLEDNRIIYPEMQSRQVANAFREIRTKLLRQAQGQNFVTMVTSVSARGGGSFIALNLAAAFAFDDSKTAMLVDCNLRDPDQHNLTGVEPLYGLTDFLEDPEIDTEKIIYPSGIHRLRVIPVGRRRENVVEHFTSIRMRTLIEGLQERYPDRYIILDAPPIGESVDARILADLCDLVVIVVDYGKVTESQVMSAVDAVGKDKLAGVLLNRDPGYALPMTFEQLMPRLTN